MLEVMVKYACFNGLFCSSPKAKRKFSSISDAPPSENYFGCRPAANKIFLYFSLQYMKWRITVLTLLTMVTYGHIFHVRKFINSIVTQKKWILNFRWYISLHIFKKYFCGHPHEIYIRHPVRRKQSYIFFWPEGEKSRIFFAEIFTHLRFFTKCFAPLKKDSNWVSVIQDLPLVFFLVLPKPSADPICKSVHWSCFVLGVSGGHKKIKNESYA